VKLKKEEIEARQIEKAGFSPLQSENETPAPKKQASKKGRSRFRKRKSKATITGSSGNSDLERAIDELPEAKRSTLNKIKDTGTKLKNSGKAMASSTAKLPTFKRKKRVLQQ
jgi:hypothetical protein